MKSAFAEHLIATGRVSRDRLQAIARSEWLDREPIGRLAMLHGLLGPEDIDEILRQQTTDDHLFGEIAIRLGILTSEQLEVLFRGQAIRACLELVEDLALAGLIDFHSGIDAMKEFVSGNGFANFLAQSAHSTV